MDVTGENNDLANWKDMFSWTLGVGKLASTRAVRGWVSARRWDHYGQSFWGCPGQKPWFSMSAQEIIFNRFLSQTRTFPTLMACTWKSGSSNGKQ